MIKFCFLLFGLVFLPSLVYTQLPKKIEIQWVQIPGGTFTMGSPVSEVGRENDEVEHEVTISPFSVSKFEVTYDQYMFFCKSTGYKKPSSDGLQKGDHPIGNVEWNDAVAFADWLGVRLLTEAEWEYVCRAGSSTPFSFGDKITSDQVNFDGNYPYNQSPKSGSKGKTMPVGSYKPNNWGVYDMHGNVSEWVSDWYGKYNLEDKINPQGPKEARYERTGKGGSFFESASEVRCAERYGRPAITFGENIGFRVAKSL